MFQKKQRRYILHIMFRIGLKNIMFQMEHKLLSPEIDVLNRTQKESPPYYAPNGIKGDPFHMHL